jgi:ion channel-forming bestrophin family protein
MIVRVTGERKAKALLLLSYVAGPLLVLLLYDMSVVVVYKVVHWESVGMPHIPLALFGSAIGLIVAFRNQSSYARWWEARTIWGALVNNSRSWARQVTTVMMPLNESDAGELKNHQRQLVYHQIAYVVALRQHLRGLEPWEELVPLLSEREMAELRDQKNVPLAIQQQMGTLLRQCQVRGWIDREHWLALENNLDDLVDAQGGVERIKNTPMPRQYDYFPHLFVQMYCLLLPLALVANMGWFTPLGSTLVGFIFLALDQIGRDLENPFENTIYDLPLTSITTTIEVNLRQMLGDTALPKPQAPVHGVLW